MQTAIISLSFHAKKSTLLPGNAHKMKLQLTAILQTL